MCQEKDFAERSMRINQDQFPYTNKLPRDIALITQDLEYFEWFILLLREKYPYLELEDEA